MSEINKEENNTKDKEAPEKGHEEEISTADKEPKEVNEKSAEEKLRDSGIAPPAHKTKDKNTLLGNKQRVECPRCKTKETELVSQFGSTACKAMYRCMSCLEPFEYFKCL